MTQDDIKQLLADADADNSIALLGHLLGLEQLKVVLDTLGGGDIYLPSYDNFIRSLTREQRDDEITRRYNGENADQLAIEYKVKPRRILQIVAAQNTSREDI